MITSNAAAGWPRSSRSTSCEVGVPALLLEADHNDPRSFSEQQVTNRLAAFIEMLGA